MKTILFKIQNSKLKNVIASFTLFAALSGCFSKPAEVKGQSSNDGKNQKTSKELSKPVNETLNVNGIPVFEDYELAKAYAKENNKPLLLDFTGWACVICRQAEDRSWKAKTIEQKLISDFVIVSLAVDDREKLPGNEHINNAKGKAITTKGEQNAFMLHKITGSDHVPVYQVADTNGKHLGKPIFGRSIFDESTFRRWLNKGLAKFNKR